MRNVTITSTTYIRTFKERKGTKDTMHKTIFGIYGNPTNDSPNGIA